jgi:hypothetical protein
VSSEALQRVFNADGNPIHLRRFHEVGVKKVARPTSADFLKKISLHYFVNRT